MTALELQIQKDMALLRDDEGMMKRLSKYVKRLIAQKNDDAAYTEEEFVAKVKQAEEEIKRGDCVSFSNMEDMDKWLDTL